VRGYDDVFVNLLLLSLLKLWLCRCKWT